MTIHKTRFRPAVQSLEVRRYMAADVGGDEGGGLWNSAGGTMAVQSDSDVAAESLMINATTISRNIANSSDTGGGNLNLRAEVLQADTLNAEATDVAIKEYSSWSAYILPYIEQQNLYKQY